MAAAVQPTPTVRPMREGDLVGVHVAECSGYAFPWSRRIFADCLRAGYCCLVIETDAGIAGHGIMMVRAGEAHILNLCIAASLRRRGLARTLLNELMDVAATANAGYVVLEVRASNKPAMALYADAGFREVGVRPDYYPAASGREDACIMSLNLDSPHAGQRRQV